MILGAATIHVELLFAHTDAAVRTNQMLVVKIRLARQENPIDVILIEAHHGLEAARMRGEMIVACTRGDSSNARLGSTSCHGSFSTIISP